MEAEPDTPKKKTGWSKRLVRDLVSGFLLAVLVLLLLGGLFVYWQLKPPEDGGIVNLSIPKGSDSRQIAALLERQGLIRDRTIFYYSLVLQGEGARFKAGDYQIRVGTSRAELIATLNDGGQSAGSTVKVTVPEGLTVRQLADRLQSKMRINADQFLQNAEAVAYGKQKLSDGSNYDWLRALPANERMIEPLEGYLFPDTYEFKADATEMDVLAEMLAQTDRKLRQLPSGWERQLDKLGISVHEMLTVASLIEREVVVPSERALVAGVIYNRLRTGMPLQIDATVQYLQPRQKERLLYKDLEVNSPYNTYRVKGLPPGPIANPGRAAMVAACFPQSTDYFFYVTKKDGSGAHLFARTFAEHKQNIARSKQQ